MQKKKPAQTAAFITAVFCILLLSACKKDEEASLEPFRSEISKSANEAALTKKSDVLTKNTADIVLEESDDVQELYEVQAVVSRPDSRGNVQEKQTNPNKEVKFQDEDSILSINQQDYINTGSQSAGITTEKQKTEADILKENARNPQSGRLEPTVTMPTGEKETSEAGDMTEAIKKNLAKIQPEMSEDIQESENTEEFQIPGDYYIFATAQDGEVMTTSGNQVSESNGKLTIRENGTATLYNSIEVPMSWVRDGDSLIFQDQSGITFAGRIAGIDDPWTITFRNGIIEWIIKPEANDGIHEQTLYYAQKGVNTEAYLEKISETNQQD